MRGDPPYAWDVSAMPTVSTPHARGSTLVDFLKRTLDLVYPACAGIHLYKRLIGDHFVRLPRMRGDPPS